MKRKKKVFFNYFILIILLFVFFNASYSLLKNYLFYRDWKNQYQVIKNKIDSQKEKEKEWDKKVEILEQKRGGEVELLKKYILKKPGEKVIRIIE